MERSQLFDLMGELQLYGMKAAFDEIMTTAVKRQHEPQRIIGDLLTAKPTCPSSSPPASSTNPSPSRGGMAARSASSNSAKNQKR
jgi:hypothetical protein